MKRDEHLKELLRCAFCLRELNLYLDTHPYDRRATAEFETCLNKFMRHRAEYSAAGGAWDVSESVKDGDFTWTDGPWPWEYDFNAEVDV